MSIDLGGALADLARSVHDDGATERLNGQVRHMVGRIRRRRAARYSATGVIGVGAAAVVAVGGLQLADRFPALTPPAATDTTAPPVPALGCGSPVSDMPALLDETFVLIGEAGTAVRGEPVPLSLTLMSLNAQTFSVGEKVQVFALQDGVIAGTAQADPTDLGLTAGVDPRDPIVTVVPCGADTSLPAGDYELVAMVTLTLADGTVRAVVSDPLPFTITEFPTEEVATAEAAVSLEALLAAPVENPDLVFPKCGTLASDALDDGMPPLELDLDEPNLELASGSRYEGTVRLHTTLGRHVLANASQTATLVVLKDGIVVGYQWLDGEDVDIVDLGDGQLLEFPVLGTMTLCGTGEGGSGPAVPLPAGEYRIMAALDVLLKEIDAESVTAPTTAVSEAGRLSVLGS